MKKFLVLFAFLVIAALCSMSAAADGAPMYNKNMADAVLLMREVDGNPTTLPYHADYSGDGKLSVYDIVKLLRHLGGIEVQEDPMVKIDQINKNYSSQAAGSTLISNALKVQADYVKGCHDGWTVIVGEKAYVVYTANDLKAGEDSKWDYIYVALSVIDLKTNTVLRSYPVAAGPTAVHEGQMQELAIPDGNAGVARLLQIDETTLRLFFTSNNSGVRQSYTYYADFDITTETFKSDIQRLQLQTPEGKVDFTAKAYYDLAVAAGHPADEVDHDGYILALLPLGDTCYVNLGNFSGAQNAFAKLTDGYTCLEILGHIGGSTERYRTTEVSIMPLNEGGWMAMLRDQTSKNYLFSYSEDGTDWSEPAPIDHIDSGVACKPFLRNFGSYYLMGWNETDRSCYHLSYSTDAKNWQDLYEIYSPDTFQYFHCFEYAGNLYYNATIGNKEQILFGRLELEEREGTLYINDGYTDTLPAECAAFEDWIEVSDTLFASSAQNSWKTALRRDDAGIWFTAQNDQRTRNTVLFLMLDTQGTATNINNADGFRFRFENGSVKVQTMNTDGTMSYKYLAAYPDIRFSRKTNDGKEQYLLFVPYSALTELAPLATFEGADSTLACSVYSWYAETDHTMLFGGFEVGRNNPTTYLKFTAENRLVITEGGGSTHLDKAPAYQSLGKVKVNEATGEHWSLGVVRDDTGIYFRAQAPINSGFEANDSVIFLLDSLGTATSYSSKTDTAAFMMFRFRNKSAQVQSYDGSSWGYKELSGYEAEFRKYGGADGMVIELFLPYTTFADLTPTPFTDTKKDLYFYAMSGYGSTNSFITVDGQTLSDWKKPSLYPIISADNKLTKR